MVVLSLLYLMFVWTIYFMFEIKIQYHAKLCEPDSFPESSASSLKVDQMHQLRLQLSLPKPHLMITKIPNLPEKENKINLVRLQSPLPLKRNLISLYPDFLPEFSKQRQVFNGVKKKRKEPGNKNSLLFPACLILTPGSEQNIFLKHFEDETFTFLASATTLKMTPLRSTTSSCP